MKDYLNDIEKEQIEAFYKNEPMREAVKKVLLAGIYHNGTLKAGEKAEPQKNFLLSMAATASRTGVPNETLGADLRAAAEGITVVEAAFKELSTFSKLVVAEKIKVNEAE